MRSALLYLIGLGGLALILGVGWWTYQSTRDGAVLVRTGDTVASIAQEAGVSEEELAAANDAEPGQLEIEPGDTLQVPPASPTPARVWATHLAGLVAEVFGVLLSFWLAIVAGLLPKRYRRQVLAISVVLGVASYATTWAVVRVDPVLTPQFLFAAIKDGFAWASAFPLFAAAFGFREAVGPAGDPGGGGDADGAGGGGAAGEGGESETAAGGGAAA